MPRHDYADIGRDFSACRNMPAIIIITRASVPSAASSPPLRLIAFHITQASLAAAAPAGATAVTIIRQYRYLAEAISCQVAITAAAILAHFRQAISLFLLASAIFYFHFRAPIRPLITYILFSAGKLFLARYAAARIFHINRRNRVMMSQHGQQQLIRRYHATPQCRHDFST